MSMLYAGGGEAVANPSQRPLRVDSPKGYEFLRPEGKRNRYVLRTFVLFIYASLP